MTDVSQPRRVPFDANQCQMGNLLSVVPLLVSLLMMQKIDMTDPDNIFRLRVSYGTITLIVLAVCGWIYLRIRSAHDQRTVEVPAVGQFGMPDPSRSSDKISVEQHDTQALRKYFNSVVMGAMISSFIHYKWGIVPPLFLQSVMQPFQLWQLPLFRLHVLGDSNPALNRRPWKEEGNSLMSLFQGSQQPPPPPSQLESSAVAAAAPVAHATTGPTAVSDVDQHTAPAAATPNGSVDAPEGLVTEVDADEQASSSNNKKKKKKKQQPNGSDLRPPSSPSPKAPSSLRERSANALNADAVD